jgi:uncharacterized protein with HEPN domain
MSRREPVVAVCQMLDHAREAWEMVQGRSRADLEVDRMLNLALVRLMEVAGEAAKRVPEAFHSRYPDVPWRRAAGLRDVLIHDYETVYFDTLRETIQNYVPPLIQQLEAIIAENPRTQFKSQENDRHGQS